MGRPVAVSLIACVLVARWTFSAALEFSRGPPASSLAWAEFVGGTGAFALTLYALLKMRRWLAVLVAADIAVRAWFFLGSGEQLTWNPVAIDYALLVGACVFYWRRMTWMFP